MKITHKRILETLVSGLKTAPNVYACWLEGSMSLKATDKYSDIDLVIDVEDGTEEKALKKVGQILGIIAPLDYISEITRPNDALWYQVFHIKGSSKFLLIDVNVQRHSRRFLFSKEFTHDLPTVLFDKANVIDYKSLDKKAFEKTVRSAFVTMKARVAESSRVEKYVKRGKYLEAWAYYHKFLLEPLIMALRIKYAPYKYDFYLVHASKDFPHDVRKKLERLFQCSSVEDIGRKSKQAERWFHQMTQEVPEASLK